MIVECSVTFNDADFDEPPSVTVTCGRCGKETESYGQHERSITRCLVLLKKNCARNELNYYVLEEDE